MTSEAGHDLEPVTVGRPGVDLDRESGTDAGSRRLGGRRWVRWLVIAVVAVLLGVWINSYASMRQQRDAALVEAARARGESVVASQRLDQLKLDSEFRSLDLLVLPDVGGVRTSLAVLNVINNDEPRTWLLLRGAAPSGQAYFLDVLDCGARVEFPPFSLRATTEPNGSLEITASNLTAPTDDDGVTVVLREAGGDPLITIEGPLVRPTRTLSGDRARATC